MPDSVLIPAPSCGSGLRVHRGWNFIYEGGIMQNLREKMLLELYEFALKYARVYRSHFIEIDDAINEMMLALHTTRWKNVEYMKEVMRKRLHRMVWKEKHYRELVSKHPWPSARVDVEESSKWDAKIMVDELLSKCSKAQRSTMTTLLQGYNVNETAGMNHTNRRTVHRHILKARELLTTNY